MCISSLDLNYGYLPAPTTCTDLEGVYWLLVTFKWIHIHSWFSICTRGSFKLSFPMSRLRQVTRHISVLRRIREYAKVRKSTFKKYGRKGCKQSQIMHFNVMQPPPPLCYFGKDVVCDLKKPLFVFLLVLLTKIYRNKSKQQLIITFLL